VFSPSPTDGVLRQGEIVSEVIQVHVRADSLAQNAADLDLEEKVHPYALILTQACDLNWDYDARNNDPTANEQSVEEKARAEKKRQGKLVPNVLLCELSTADSLRLRLADAGLLTRIRANREERFQCLPAVSPKCDLAGGGLPELIADFKRVFSIPTDELYLRLNLGMRRRTLLDTPFLQHLSARFGYYCLRVALPENAPVALRPAQAAIALPAAAAPDVDHPA